MLKLSFDTDLLASVDVQYAIYKAPASGSNRLLGESVTSGYLGSAPTSIDSNGNIELSLSLTPELPFPASYLMIMQGTKAGKRWGTGRIPFTYNGPNAPTTPPPPSGEPPPAGGTPEAVWGTTAGAGGAPTVYAPKIVYYPTNTSYQFEYTLSGPTMAMNNSYQTWAEPGAYVTSVSMVRHGVYKGVFHTNGYADGTYDFYIIARNDNGQTRHDFKVVVGSFTVVDPPDDGGGGGGGEDGGSQGTDVPEAIKNLAAAPWFRSPQDYTTLWSTSPGAYIDNSYGEWPSLKLRGAFQAEANAWAVGPNRDQWNIHNNPNLFSMYTALSPVSSDMTVNFYMKAHCAVGLSKEQWGPGAHSEVKAYPSLGMGALMGLTHRQDQQGIPRDVAAPLPCKLSDIRTFWLGWRKKTLNISSNAVGHLCHDMRVCISEERTSTYVDYGMRRPEEIFGCEFMIVHKQFGGYGNTDYRGMGRMFGTPTINGMKYYVYIQEGATIYPDTGTRAMLLCFIPEVVNNGGELPDQFNIEPVLQYCYSTSYRQLTNGPGGTGKRPGYWWRYSSNNMDAALMPSNGVFHQDVVGIEIEEGDFEVLLEGAFCRVNK